MTNDIGAELLGCLTRSPEPCMPAAGAAWVHITVERIARADLWSAPWVHPWLARRWAVHLRYGLQWPGSMSISRGK